MKKKIETIDLNEFIRICHLRDSFENHCCLYKPNNEGEECDNDPFNNPNKNILRIVQKLIEANSIMESHGDGPWADNLVECLIGIASIIYCNGPKDINERLSEKFNVIEEYLKK